MDRYVTIAQGEVFYITEALASLEGLEKGPAGNTALAAAFSIAQEMDRDHMIVVQETEYTGAGKHIQASFPLRGTTGSKSFSEIRRKRFRERTSFCRPILPSLKQGTFTSTI
jgi:hypothetical protein